MNLREWKESLRDAKSQSSVEGFTRAELAQDLGVSDRTAITEINREFRLGHLKMSGKRQVEGIDGRTVWVPVYRAVQRREALPQGDGAPPDAA